MLYFTSRFDGKTIWQCCSENDYKFSFYSETGIDFLSFWLEKEGAFYRSCLKMSEKYDSLDLKPFYAYMNGTQCF